jgi:hypothetical protein
MIGGGDHFWACLRYVDLDMIRAGVMRHPREWEWSAWHELSGTRKRYRLIDRDALLDRMGASLGPVSRSTMRNSSRMRSERARIVNGTAGGPNRWVWGTRSSCEESRGCWNRAAIAAAWGDKWGRRAPGF